MRAPVRVGRPVLAFALLSVPACQSAPVGGPSAIADAVALHTAPSLWDSVDPAFEGCAGGCGTRAPNAEVVAQPGAAPGQFVFCPVSGVRFEVTTERPHADVAGKPVYFCCEACAQFFGANRDQVLAARGIATK